MFLSLVPLTFVDFAVGPLVRPFSMWMIIDKVSLVDVSILVDFEAHAVSLVIDPLAFVDTTVLVDLHAHSFAFLESGDLTFVAGILVTLDAKVGCFHQLLVVEEVRLHFVV